MICSTTSVNWVAGLFIISLDQFTKKRLFFLSFLNIGKNQNDSILVCSKKVNDEGLTLVGFIALLILYKIIETGI